MEKLGKVLGVVTQIFDVQIEDAREQRGLLMREVCFGGFAGYLVPTAPTPISKRGPSGSSSPTCSRLVAQATALRQLQRRCGEVSPPLQRRSVVRKLVVGAVPLPG